MSFRRDCLRTELRDANHPSGKEYETAAAIGLMLALAFVIAMWL
jgi:hypothetical protein